MHWMLLLLGVLMLARVRRLVLVLGCQRGLSLWHGHLGRSAIGVGGRISRVGRLSWGICCIRRLHWGRDRGLCLLWAGGIWRGQVGRRRLLRRWAGLSPGTLVWWQAERLGGGGRRGRGLGRRISRSRGHLLHLGGRQQVRRHGGLLDAGWERHLGRGGGQNRGRGDLAGQGVAERGRGGWALRHHGGRVVGQSGARIDQRARALVRRKSQEGARERESEVWVLVCRSR